MIEPKRTHVPGDAQQISPAYLPVCVQRAAANSDAAARKEAQGCTKKPALRRYEKVKKTLKHTHSQACPKSAMRAQGAIGLRSSAIHNDCRVSRRPSLVPEPKFPSLKVVLRLAPDSFSCLLTKVHFSKGP